MTTQFVEGSLRTQDFVELENKYGAHNHHPLDVVIERAEGVWGMTSRASVTWIAWPPTPP